MARLDCSQHGERALAAKERSERIRRMYNPTQTRAAVSKHPQAIPFEAPPSPTFSSAPESSEIAPTPPPCRCMVGFERGTYDNREAPL